MKDQQDELQREGDEEEGIKLEETDEDLVIEVDSL